MLPSGHFEEIVAQDVLEHPKREDPPGDLARWASLLKDGGRPAPLRSEDCISTWGKPSAIAEAHAAGRPLTWTAGYPA